MGHSIEEFHMASHREGRIDLLSPRRHSTGASLAPPQTYHGRTPTSPSSDGTFIRRGNEHKPMLSHPVSSRRQHNDGMS
jgi:hypothetical protein